MKKHRGLGWRSSLTHCPQGHEYTPENIYRNPKTGHRMCRACMAIRNKRPKTGSYAAGWRDQECPICGAKWFVDASSHVRKVHGLRMPGLVSEARRASSAALLEDIDHFKRDAREVWHRHHRWADIATEEHANGGAWVKRLARRWHISYGGAANRVKTLRRLNLLAPTEELSARERRSDRDPCKRGHPRTPENTYWWNDQRHCRVCQADRQRLRRAAP